MSGIKNIARGIHKLWTPRAFLIRKIVNFYLTFVTSCLQRMLFPFLVDFCSITNPFFFRNYSITFIISQKKLTAVFVLHPYCRTSIARPNRNAFERFAL